MSDALTPERRHSHKLAILAARANAQERVGIDLHDYAALLDAADEVARLRAEVESYREARQMLVDDLIALGEGKSGKLKLSRGVEQRIADLKDENATLRDALADLIGDGHFLQSAWKHAAELLGETAPKEPAK